MRVLSCSNGSFYLLCNLYLHYKNNKIFHDLFPINIQKKKVQTNKFHWNCKVVGGVGNGAIKGIIAVQGQSALSHK